MKLLETGTAAHLLRLSVSRVRQLVDERKLRVRFRTARGHRLFARADVEALASARKAARRRRATRVAETGGE